MKYSLVISVLVILSSAPQAEQYSWNYMDIGFSEDGLGSGPTFSVASHVAGNLFARANIFRNQQQISTQPINSLFSFYTAGYQYRLLFIEAGVSQYEVCWYACASYTGNVAMLGLVGGSGKFKAKISAGALDLMAQEWLVIEADASYAVNDHWGISLGVMDLDELAGNVTKLGVRMTW